MSEKPRRAIFFKGCPMIFLCVPMFPYVQNYLKVAQDDSWKDEQNCQEPTNKNVNEMFKVLWGGVGGG